MRVKPVKKRKKTLKLLRMIKFWMRELLKI
jgi:hypothetical protein